VTSKDRIKDTLAIRNEIALTYRLPTEVKVLNENTGEVFAELKKHTNAILNIIEHNDLNYYLLNASFLLGIPVYFSDGQGLQQLPTLSSRFKDVFCPDEIKILESLRQESTHEELVAKTKLDNSLLFYYLYGKNSHTGLIKLGLVADKNDKITLTEFGRLVVES
jgi:hypothetical protein